MTTFKTMMITLAALAAAAQVNAAEPSSARTAELRAAQETLAWEASKTKGGARQELLLEQQRLEGLIQDLEQGRRVDPSEIDRALDKAR